MRAMGVGTIVPLPFWFQAIFFSMKQVERVKDAYQVLFDFLAKEHGITLTVAEMDEVVHECAKLRDSLLRSNILAVLSEIERTHTYEISIESMRCIIDQAV